MVKREHMVNVLCFAQQDSACEGNFRSNREKIVNMR